MLARLAVLAAATAAIAVVASVEGRAAGLMVAAACLFALGFVKVWAPRTAHRAFIRGNFARARLWYRGLRYGLLDRRARASVAVSVAACSLALDQPDAALATLDTIDPERLTESARAAWLNNRAYALARLGRDLDRALADSEAAIALRPDVAGFKHTRGVILLELGRVDDAIRDLEAVWGALRDEAPPLLEAERCFDLGRAWRRKGESEYAHDYFERARRAAPTSTWARLAADELPEPEAPLSALAELV